MKAVLISAPGQVSLTELEQPSIGPEDVLIHSRAVGICGSDVELYREPGQKASIATHSFRVTSGPVRSSPLASAYARSH